MRKIKLFLICICVTGIACSFSAKAQSISLLTIEGNGSLPGILGDYSITSPFSWMRHRFPDASINHGWQLGAGTDGGIRFDQAQIIGEMMSTRLMFNQPTTFFSVGAGLAKDNEENIDMANLRMWQNSSIIDIGSGAGVNTFVPLVSDTAILSQGQNGWMLNQDGSYNLIYNTIGVCDGCTLMIQLYGIAVVPIPAALPLFLSGAVLLAGFGRKRSSLQV